MFADGMEHRHGKTMPRWLAAMVKKRSIREGNDYHSGSQHQPFDFPSLETDRVQTDLPVNGKRRVCVSQRSPAYESSIDCRTPNASPILWCYRLR